MNFFNKLKINSAFPVCYNLLPHYSAAGQSNAALMKCVAEALGDGRIQAFFLSDKPVNPQEASSRLLAEKILAAGGEPIISLALTFDDRAVIVEKIKQYQRIGVRQFLFVSGEYPPKPKDRQPEQPLYDLDCVQLLMLLDELGESAGRLQSHPPPPGEELKIVKGCVVSPFKSLESEQVMQYQKLKRKIAVGADFVITQLGYDMRKYDELVRFCSLENISTPLVANVFITDHGTASLFGKRNIPGMTIPARLQHTLSREASDPLQAGKNSLTRSAKTVAVLRGLGYSGILIGAGSTDFSAVRQVLDKTESLQSDWQHFLDELDYSGPGFYYFQRDSKPGLNTNTPSPLSPKHPPTILYTFSYFVDWMVYLPRGPFFKTAGRFCRFCSNKKFWYRFMWLNEFLSKGLLYGCTMCGDCVLYACGFLCYRSGCPKKSVNGPCGGSVNGFCEVYPGKKKCYWVKVYKQLKGVAQHVTYSAPPVPARDNTLNKTSSWINFFMGRDHRQMRFKDD